MRFPCSSTLLLVPMLTLAIGPLWSATPSASANRQAVVDVSMAWFDKLWDERAALIWEPSSTGAPNWSTHLVRSSAWYAFGLLARDAPGDRDRAARLLDSVLKQQIMAPGQPWDGTFYRKPEQAHLPLFPRMWDDYDPNWRQFIGCAFALSLHEYPDRMPADLASRLLASISRALDGEIAQARLSPDYTNIALMQAFLLDFVGEHLGRPDYTRQALALAEAVHAGFNRHHAFEEYNSPTYYGVDFLGLVLWRKYAASARLRTLGAELEAALWRDTADFYHAGLRNLCGPYDRSYGMDMRRYASLLGLWLRLELPAHTAPFPPLTERPMAHGHDFFYAPVFAVMGTNIPKDALATFRTFSGPRLVVRTLPRGRTATAWLDHHYMLGGTETKVGRGAGGPHNQLHPATVHWQLPDGGIGWILLTDSSRLDARASPGRLSIKAIGDAVFRLNAPGIEPVRVTGTSWRLPGLSLEVTHDAITVEFKAGDGWVDATYRSATSFELIIAD